MSKDELIASDIVISTIKDSVEKIEITSVAGAKFSFFKQKKDGNPTKAFESFQLHQLAAGSPTKVKYSKAGQYGNINSAAWFEVEKTPGPTPIPTPAVQTSVPQAPRSQVAVMINPKPQGTNWDAIGLAKAATALYAACYQRGDSFVDASQKVGATLEEIRKVQQPTEIPF